MDSVTLSGVRKAYGGRTVLDVDLSIPRGQFFVLVGPSGSGKTTLLRILAGLVRPDAGAVSLDGADVSAKPPHERPVGVVFQGLALWPHLSVRGNLALGLDRVVPDASERGRRIDAVARELGIEQFLKSRPHRLSGGERQRVALARALVRRPSVLLLDEAFSDLDARLRRSTARLVRRLYDEHGMTTVLITHDRTDAHLLADRIAVLRNGRIVADGSPDELYRNPGNAFAAEFLSDAALLSGAVRDGAIQTALGSLPIANTELAEAAEALVAIRPDEVALGDGPVSGTVLACEFAGGPWLCRIQVGEQQVSAVSDVFHKAGTEIRLAPPRTQRVALEENR